MLTDEQIRNILGMHGALPLKDGATDSIIEGREAILIVAIRAILAAHSAGAQEPVAEVESWTNGSYHRNYKLRWLKDVEAGAKLYAHPQPMPQTDAARDVKRLDWLMQHVCCDDFPGISIELGLSREEHYAEFRRQIDAEIERIDRAKGE